MQIKVDDTEGSWEELTGQKTVAFEATEGEHTIYARFKDDSGNTSGYVSVKYYYDITPPEITLEYSETGLTNQFL
ncbi:MAG TPA: hypothetical protein GXX20_05520 [Clostridiaceae bacterium]|nr:hypothetical protein [Clostridiaceae bacterium]